MKDLYISTSSFVYLVGALIANKKVQMFDNYQKSFYELYKLDKPYPVLSQLLLVISVLPERYCWMKNFFFSSWVASIRILKFLRLLITIIIIIPQQSLNSGFLQVQILFVVCQIFAKVRISINSPGSKKVWNDLLISHFTKTIYHRFVTIVVQYPFKLALNWRNYYKTFTIAQNY